MKKQAYLWKALIIGLIAALPVNLLAQSDPDCPGGSSVAWNPSEVSYSNYYGLGGSVQYKAREVNGQIQAVMDWSTLNNQSDHLSDDALKRLLEESAVLYALKSGSPEAPHFEFSKDIKVYYKRPCLMMTCITMKLSEDASLDCCDPGGTNDGEIQTKIENGQTVRYSKRCKPVIWGYKCCARNYHCYSTFDQFIGTQGDWVWAADAPTTLSIAPCSSILTSEDCQTGVISPCFDGTCDGF